MPRYFAPSAEYVNNYAALKKDMSQRIQNVLQNAIHSHINSC